MEPWRSGIGGVPSAKAWGMRWPDLDEDISVANLLAGKPSAESQTSLQRWLQQRSVAKE